jgi:hypothetical protein
MAVAVVVFDVPTVPVSVVTGHKDLFESPTLPAAVAEYLSYQNN